MSVYGYQPESYNIWGSRIDSQTTRTESYEIKEGDRPMCDDRQLHRLLPYVVHVVQHSGQQEIGSLADQIKIRSCRGDFYTYGAYPGIKAAELVVDSPIEIEAMKRVIASIQKICEERLTTPLQTGPSERHRFLEFKIVKRCGAFDSIIVNYRVSKTKEIFENIMKELEYMFPSVPPASSCVVM